MTAIKRTIDAGTLAAITAVHTQPLHIVRLEFPTDTVYLSEGPSVTFNGNVYLEGRIRVSNLSWTGEGVQTCSLEILNEAGYAATLFFQNRVADVLVTVWAVYRNSDGSFTTPVLCVVGTGEDSELTPEYLKLEIISSKYKTKFFPNTYMGSAGFTHIPAEGTVVFWNSTGYVLERAYG